MCPSYFNYYNYFDVCCKHLSFGRALNPSKSVFGCRKTRPPRSWRSFAAMELCAMQVLSRDLGSAHPALVLRAISPPGSCGKGSELMGCEVLPPESCDAALGGVRGSQGTCNNGAEKVHRGVDERMPGGRFPKRPSHLIILFQFIVI